MRYRGRPEDMGRMGEKAGKPAAAVLDAAAATAHRERHVAGLGRDAELPQECCEAGIRPLVEDDEARVDADAPRQGDRACVSAGRARGLVHRDGVSRVQRPRRDQAGDAAADDGYSPAPAHRFSSQYVPPGVLPERRFFLCGKWGAGLDVRKASGPRPSRCPQRNAAVESKYVPAGSLCWTVLLAGRSRRDAVHPRRPAVEG